MNAIHIKKSNIKDNLKLTLEDFDILSTILSALKWRENNGNITLFTDTVSYKYYKKIGILNIWNDINVCLDDNNTMFDKNIFWAGGKIFALSHQKIPCVILDTDFIVWKKINFSSIPYQLAVIHRENLNPEVYPNSIQFTKFDDDFDWNIKPSNTAFMYINNQEFLEYYTKTAINFMQKTKNADNYLTYMVFAEQRLFSMCAKKLGLSIYSFSTLEKLFENGENYFTHIWGFKEQMRKNFDLRKDFCLKCISRILKDFPYMTDTLKHIPQINDYFK